MILIRNDIIPHVEIPDKTITDTHLEIIWIKTKAYPPIYIGAYYGKQENCKLAEISEEYERLSNSICGKNTCNKEIILMGDFNAKLEIEKEGMKQNQSRNGKLLYQLLETTGMTTVNTRREHIGTWTRVNTSNANEKSIIDYAIITNGLRDKICESETDTNNTLNIRGKHVTDHRAITLTIQLKRTHKPDIIHIWKKGDIEKWKGYNDEICKIWKSSEYQGYDTLHKAIISALNKHIGKMSFDTNKKMKTSNDTIKTLRKERKQLRSNFKEMCKHGNSNNKTKAKEEYLNCQSKHRNEIGKEETKRNDDKLMTLIHSGGINSNNFWQIRKKILRQKSDVYNLVNEDGNEIENKLEAMEYTANYYEDLYQARKGDESQVHWTHKIEHHIKKLEKLNHTKPEETRKLSMRELNLALKQLSRGKSPGPDNIPNEALIETNKDTRRIFLQVFNKIYADEEIPKTWCEGNIIKIYKGKGKKGKCSNERGITLSSNLGKLFERVINNRIKEVINMTPNQGGGIKGKSTSDHLIRITNFIKSNKAKKQKPILVFLDVTKAYDKAWSKAIMYALDKSGIKGKDWTITKKLNENLTARIQTNYGYTRKVEIKDSIRQGGILSVLQYANLMDEITKEIAKNPNCNINIGNETTPGCFLWMDDVLLMHTDPKIIQVMLDTTYKIAQRYRIKFGTEKSKVLQIGPGQQHSQQHKFTLGPQELEATDTYKYLGITINTKGDLSDHLKIIKGKTQASINPYNNQSGK